MVNDRLSSVNFNSFWHSGLFSGLSKLGLIKSIGLWNKNLWLNPVIKKFENLATSHHTR